VALHGYVAAPDGERGSAGLQYWFVNGRWVRDRALAQALHEAYRGLLRAGRHPVAFLALEVPPDAVDVNVHPTKAEVRFHDGPAVQQFVRDAVGARLRAHDWTGRLEARAAPGGHTAAPPPEATLGFPSPAPPPTGVKAAGSGGGVAAPPGQARPSPVRGAERRSGPPSGPGRGAGGAEAGAAGGPVRALQVHDRYLLVEVPEGVLVIDQHALHERILFEQLKARVRSGPLEKQRLPVPEAVGLTAVQAARALEHRAALAELGLDVEDLGGGTVLLSSYPALLGRRPPAEVLRAVVDDLGAQERVPCREALLHDLLSLLACHAAVRAGDRLTPEEVAALVARRELARDAHHCPHGRPTALLFSRQDLDRQFRRR
jgi:DNA mismatch repair protein MutL